MSAAEFSPFDLLPDEIVIKIILEAVNTTSWSYWSYSEIMDYRNIIHHQIEKSDFLRIAMVSTRFKRLTEDKCFDEIIIKIIREAVKSSFSINSEWIHGLHGDYKYNMIMIEKHDFFFLIDNIAKISTRFKRLSEDKSIKRVRQCGRIS